MTAAALLAAVLTTPAAADGDPIHYRLEVRLRPADHRIEATATVELPEPPADGVVRFVLHDGLAPVSETAGVKIEPEDGRPDPDRFGLAPEPDPFPEDVPLRVYRVVTSDGAPPPRSFTVRYAGAIDHPIEARTEEYARSFSETPGTISADGVFLAGSTFWYPWLGSAWVTHDLEVETGAGWEAVSEGRRAVREAGADGVTVRWESPEPLEEIHVVAGPWTVYEDVAGPVATYAYLRTPDSALARKYLDTTAQYLEMYGKLIGPYPFAKFALVENFWETGYGMPSFTLLGPKIIRFPFILHSSYPHEILHNWWGNGVYVDVDGGNWCEGLTAYLADHLVKEQRGQGAEYRRDLLQKYADYVREGLDLPLTEFRSRHSSATQAVGYGKTAMVFHMLRRRLGDGPFVDGLRKLYADNRFRRASWSDVRRAFEDASGDDLGGFFRAWIERTGAPVLRITEARATGPAEGQTGHVLELGLEQDAAAAPYPLFIPVAVTIEGQEVASAPAVALRAASERFRLELPGRPVRVRVDPAFGVFRRLDRAEIPASLGRVFGAERVALVLPVSAPPALAEAYRGLAEAWSGGEGEVEVLADADLERLPEDRAVWVLGWDNRLRPELERALGRPDAALDSLSLRIGETVLERVERSVVVAVPHPADPDLAVGFVGADDPAAVPGLARKLPHYGKYGYLGFEGEEPTNVFKGQWEPIGSPLDRLVTQPDGTELAVPAALIPAFPPLAEQPPGF